MKYTEQLKTKEWKSKREEILKRDEYKCTECNTTKNLHVHHLYYTDGKMAWEYDDDALVTLCRHHHKLRHKEEPPYVKLYLPNVFDLNNVNSTSKNILLGLLPMMDYSNIIEISTYRKKQLAEKLETSIQTINNSLAKLTSNEIFIKLGTGSYLVNPKYFAKGKWADIQKIRTTIEYSKEGRFVTTEFDRVV